MRSGLPHSSIDFVAINNSDLPASPETTPDAARLLVNRFSVLEAAAAAAVAAAAARPFTTCQATDQAMWQWLFPVLMPGLSRMIVAVVQCQQTAPQRRYVAQHHRRCSR